MPYEIIVQKAFTERLPDNGVRVREPGDHISDQEWVENLAASPDDDAITADIKGPMRASVVRIWVDDPPPAPAKTAPPAPKAPVAPVADPALAPSKS